MIKQDYLIRMIQEIISLIVNALLKKKKYRWNEWTEYDGLTRQILGFPTDELLSMNTQELIDRYKGDPNEMEAEDLLRKSKLHQDGLELLKYVQKESTSFSIQRVQLINMLETSQLL